MEPVIGVVSPPTGAGVGVVVPGASGGTGVGVGLGILPPNRRGWGGAGTGLEEVSPPRMRKVMFVTGKIRFRWVEIVLRANAVSIGSIGRSSLRVRIGPPTNLSLSLFVKLTWTHWNVRSAW